MDAISRALGITRVARVTGLDRAGVEVACAIRPGGHVLQVSNGKGATFARARRSAVSEAAELWAAERPDPARFVFASWRELADAGRDAWDPVDLGSGGAPLAGLWTPGVRLAWVPARELFTGAPVLVPAQAVFCPPPGAAQLGPAVVRWSSNGMGAHPQPARALDHALREAIERDQLARSLPEGWTPQALRRRKVSVRTMAAGLEVHVFDLSAEIALPVAGALLLDREVDAPVPVAAGYACARSFDEAAEAAVLEAAQSRLTDVHGAREDIAPMDRAEAAALRDACLRARRLSRPLRRTGGDPLRALWRAGYRRAAVVELASSPLRVVKVLVPGLLVSELL